MFNFYEEPRLMVVTLHGPPGPGVASHAQEDFSNVFVHAPIPHLPMEEQTAGDWVWLWTREDVIIIGARVS